MVVPYNAKHPAMLRRAGLMAVANGVDTAVNARAFAVPNREHAIVISIAEHTGLLRAPNRCGGKILVDRRQKMDVEIRQEALARPKFLVEIVHRRAAVSGNKAPRLQAVGRIPDMLHHRRADQSLRAGDVD